MKQLLLLLGCCLLTLSLTAQTPPGINYQAVARDGDGALLRDQDVAVTFTIRPTTGGTSTYAERHNLTTNAYGLFSTVIGRGRLLRGDFATIDWSVAYELGVEVNGTDLGFVPFQSVPYALNTAPRRQVIGIPAALFAPNNNVADFRNGIGSGGATITATNDAPVTSVLIAPVHLPHGARIESMTAYFIDASEAELIIWLAREDFESAFMVIGDLRPTGNQDGVRNETVAIDHTVNNETSGYFLRVFCDDWEAAGRKDIKGVKIVYTY